MIKKLLYLTLLFGFAQNAFCAGRSISKAEEQKLLGDLHGIGGSDKCADGSDSWYATLDKHDQEFENVKEQLIKILFRRQNTLAEITKCEALLGRPEPRKKPRKVKESRVFDLFNSGSLKKVMDDSINQIAAGFTKVIGQTPREQLGLMEVECLSPMERMAYEMQQRKKQEMFNQLFLAAGSAVSQDNEALNSVNATIRDLKRRIAQKEDKELMAQLAQAEELRDSMLPKPVTAPTARVSEISEEEAGLLSNIAQLKTEIAQAHKDIGAKTARIKAIDEIFVGLEISDKSMSPLESGKLETERESLKKERAQLQSKIDDLNSQKASYDAALIIFKEQE